MNKLEVGNNLTQLDNIIINDYTKLNDLNNDSLLIYIPKNIDTTLELTYKDYSLYTKVFIVLEGNSKLNLLEYKNTIEDLNCEYTIILKDDSNLTFNKFYNSKIINELTTINLDGINSQINYNFSTITDSDQKYILNINHHQINTISNINNHCVSLSKSKIELEVNDFVIKGMRDCIINQDNKIMMTNDNDCFIKPNLYIDEYQVEARHGASIGKFNDNELFYLQTRGISKDKALKLLINGFLIGILNLNEEWRIKIINNIENI
ncbi:MAG: SufD family Fe-S cluster assembly protein [Bacilli bacterium]|nr:SufD family Fe-S cluster assembly protein [Bacilli bacterium]